MQGDHNRYIFDHPFKSLTVKNLFIRFYKLLLEIFYNKFEHFNHRNKGREISESDETIAESDETIADVQMH
jgi:hypothetical protein